MIQKIKKFFSSWDFARYFKAGLAIALTAGYFSTSEPMYMVGAFFFAAQAVFNVGCPGGTCETKPINKEKQTTIVVEKYEPTKNK